MSIAYSGFLPIIAVLCAATYAQISIAKEARPVSVEKAHVPLKDVRSNGPASARFAATQFTKEAPTILLFGLKSENWPKVRRAVQQAAYDGYPIAGIFYGSADIAPSLEIIAKGQRVSRPIDPNTISPSVLTRLVKDVVKEFYQR